MTFLEMCQRLRQEVGASGTGPHSVSGQEGEYARLVSWVRQGWLDIQLKRADWSFNWGNGETPVTEDFSMYAMPDDFRDIVPESVSLDGDNLKVVNWREFRDLPSRRDGEKPTTMAISPSGEMHLDAVPVKSGAVKFEYYRIPQVLSGNTEDPRIPSRFCMVIVYTAMSSYGYYEAAQEVIDRAQVGYQSMIYQMEDELLPNVALGGGLV